MNVSEVKAVCREYGLAPSKKFGQNFLVDGNTIEKLINAIDADKKTEILEIGPGLGAVTLPLSRISRKVTAVEIDFGLFRYLGESLRNEENIEIIHGDFLKTSLEDSYDIIVSNLPYYCSTEIIFNIAQNFHAKKIYIMLQKELGGRMTAPAGTREYGALTAVIWLYFNVKKLFTVKAGAFYPRPDVVSSFIKLERKGESYSPVFKRVFHEIVKAAFWGRRKKIAGSLSGAPNGFLPVNAVDEILKSAEIDSFERADQIAPERYAQLTLAVLETEFRPPAL